MNIIETEIFKRNIKALKINNNDLDKMKSELSLNPNKGDVIQDTGGCRKIRMSINDSGKSSGARVIYFYLVVKETVYLLSIYKKNKKETLSHSDKTLLKQFSNILKIRKDDYEK